MTVSDTDLKKEYLLLQREFLLSGSDLKRLALNAVAGAFVEEEERTALRQRIERDFFQWLEPLEIYFGTCCHTEGLV